MRQVTYYYTLEDADVCMNYGKFPNRIDFEEFFQIRHMTLNVVSFQNIGIKIFGD